MLGQLGTGRAPVPDCTHSVKLGDGYSRPQGQVSAFAAAALAVWCRRSIFQGMSEGSKPAVRPVLVAIACCVGALWIGCSQPLPGTQTPPPRGAEPSKPASTGDTSAAAHADRIRLASPVAGASVRSPLQVAGEARGPWFFEASFPVTLLDANGSVLAQSPAQARGEWMIEGFAPFEAQLIFPPPTTPTGTLVLSKSNPADLPEHAAEVRIGVRFDAAGLGAAPSGNAAEMYATLGEAEYPLELSPTGRIRLTHGAYEASSAPGSGARLDVRLGKDWATGDLNADDKPDAALILIVQAGGSGTFSYLTVAQTRGSTPEPVASVLLGDRVTVERLSIEAGEVVVQWLTRASGEPMTTAPRIPKTAKYVLRGDKLLARDPPRGGSGGPGA